MARLQKHRRSKALPSTRKSSRFRNPIRRAVSGPKRIMRYLFSSRKKRYSWTLFQISTAEPFFITPTSPESMQIHLDLDGEGGISGNTRGSHSPHRGVDGLQVRNRRSVLISGSTVGSLSFTPKTGVMGGSPGGGRRNNDSDRGEGLGDFATARGEHREDSDSDNDSGKDLWLLTYKYFRNQHPASARKKSVSITTPASPSPSSSSSKPTAPSSTSDNYVADFDLEADPWLLTYNFLDSLNNNEQDNDSALQQRETVNKEPKKTIRDGRSLRRKRNNADIRVLWARDNEGDEVVIPSASQPLADNEVQNPIHKATPAPAVQHPRPLHTPAPAPTTMPNPLPTKYFLPHHTHLSHQGSGSRYPYPPPIPPPSNLRINVPALETPLTDPEPPTPLPTMQNFEAAPLSDRQGERGGVVEWHNSREDPLELEDQRPNSAPSEGSSAHRMGKERQYSADAQEQAAINFTNSPPPPVKNKFPTVLRAGHASRHFIIDPTPPPVVVDRFPTVLRSGQASPHFNAHLNFSFDTPNDSYSLQSPLFNSPANSKPICPAASPQSSSPPPPLPPPSSPPPTLSTFPFTFPFETSPSPTLEEKLDQEYEAALSRWIRDGEKREKRVRRSRDVRECMRRLRECTAFEGEGEGEDGEGEGRWGF